MTFYLIVEHDIHMNVPVTGMTKTSRRYVVLFLELVSKRKQLLQAPAWHHDILV